MTDSAEKDAAEKVRALAESSDLPSWALTAHHKALAAALAQAWDEGMRHESDYLSTFGQFCPCRDDHNPHRVIPPASSHPTDRGDNRV